MTAPSGPSAPTEADGPTEAEWERLERRRRRAPFPHRQVGTMLALLVTLVALMMLRDPCADGVGNIYRQFELDAGLPAPYQLVPAPMPPE